MLAHGLVDIYERVTLEGHPVQQDASLPPIARRALARLSRHCIEESAADIGSSIHIVMGLAALPMSEWGVSCFCSPFRYADVVLANAEFGTPTDDCRQLARLGGREIDAAEDIHHEQLRSAILSYPAAQRHIAYTAIREFIVRHPAAALDVLNRFIIEGGHARAARALGSFYRPVPQNAVVGGRARLCGRCGSLLWPDRNPAYASGRCRVRRCAMEGDTVAGAVIAEPSTWRLAAPAILAFWVGPGFDEVQLYDALVAAGYAAALYPQSDAADIALDGLEVGIDVKSYFSPLLLASRLTHSIGRLAMFERRLIVVPDYKLRLNPHYIDHLRDAYSGEHSLEIMSSGQLLAEFCR